MSSSIVLSSFVFVKESKIYFYICDILSFVTLFLSFLFYYYFLLSRLIYWSNASNAFYFISVEFCLSSFSFFSTSAFSSDFFAKIYGIYPDIIFLKSVINPHILANAKDISEHFCTIDCNLDGKNVWRENSGARSPTCQQSFWSI
jgi:hypothetical protein